jgi:hypothetical protein
MRGGRVAAGARRRWSTPGSGQNGPCVAGWLKNTAARDLERASTGAVSKDTELRTRAARSSIVLLDQSCCPVFRTRKKPVRLRAAGGFRTSAVSALSLSRSTQCALPSPVAPARVRTPLCFDIAEVREHPVAGSGHQNVLGLHVSMNDPAFVHGSEALQNAAQHGTELFQRPHGVSLCPIFERARRTRASFCEPRFHALGCTRAREGALVSHASFLASGVAGRDPYASRAHHQGGTTVWDSATWATWAT